MATATAPGPNPANPPSDGLPVEWLRVPDWARRVPMWAWATGGLVLLIAVSAYMRSRQLGGQFWIDEGITTGIATHSLSQIPGVLKFDGNPPLYYMLLHVWISAFGDSETATHSLSLLFGLAVIPVAGWGCWKLLGPRAGVMAAILFAFDAWLSAYAEETRMYEMMAFLGTVATIAFVFGFVQRKRGWLFLYGATLTAMLYTHSWGALFFAGSAIAGIPAVLAAEDRKRLLIDGVITYVIAGALYLPWAPTLLYQIAHTAAPWDTAPRFGAPIQVSRSVIGGDRITVILVFGAVVGLAPLFTRRFRRTPEATTLWTLIALPVAVLALGWLESQVNPAWSPRYFAPVIPAMLFLIAWGLSRAKVLGIICLMLGVWYLHNPASFVPDHKSDMRQVSAEMSPRLHKGDVVVTGQPESMPLAWYYLPGGLKFANTASDGRLVKDPRYYNWSDSLKHLKHTQPIPSLNRIVDGMHRGQQLLFVRPLTEGAQNWKAPWTRYIRRRSAQWGAGLTADVRKGILTPLDYAPHHYHDTCCVADSAVIYRVDR
jgi:mannosyltransferase